MSFDDARARATGTLAGRARTSDIVDACVMQGALRRDQLVISSEEGDLNAIAESISRRIEIDRPYRPGRPQPRTSRTVVELIATGSAVILPAGDSRKLPDAGGRLWLLALLAWLFGRALGCWRDGADVGSPVGAGRLRCQVLWAMVARSETYC